MQSDPKILAETLLSASILEAIPDAVAAVNQQGVIIQVNSQTETLFGYTRDELIGNVVQIIAHDLWLRADSQNFIADPFD